MGAPEERLRLDTLHNEELHRFGKTQEQERNHIAQKQAQEREHRRLMLGIEHQAIHDAAITRQQALNQQEFEQRERMLKLERQYASTKMAVEPGESVPEPEDAASGNAGLGNEAMVVSRERVLESENVGPGNGDSKAKMSKKGRSRVEEFEGFAKAAAKRKEEEKRRG
ncbi:MAG: hypothetical protein Q9175_002317 [Cornicularia normoerica]